MDHSQLAVWQVLRWLQSFFGDRLGRCCIAYLLVVAIFVVSSIGLLTTFSGMRAVHGAHSADLDFP
jgi:hypothetical protein